ncbi:MAG: carboxylesterase/lipase family protein, partial [Comamonadaceae bacterium]
MPESHSPIRRRSLLGAAAAGAMGWSSVARAVTETDIFPVVETSNGKLRGLLSGGVAVFKG